MIIAQMLESEHSKKQTMEIVNLIGNDQKKFNELFRLFRNGSPKIVQRAAWPLSYAAISHPHFISEHYNFLFKKLKDPSQHEAVKRHIVKIFSELDAIPEKYHGELMDTCLGLIEDPKTKVSVQAYSLKILKKLCKLYPEIASEIKLIIEEKLPNARPAFKASARDVIKIRYK